MTDGWITGRVVKALSGFYYVECFRVDEAGLHDGIEDQTVRGAILTCRARGKFRKDGVTPLVGDRVEVRELGGGEGFLERILPRRNAFTRPAVANLDRLVILASAAAPKTEPFLIDRMLCVAALKHCDALVLLNKCDLDYADDLYALYKAAGIPVLRVSAVTGEGLDTLREHISGTLSAFTGNSGVGKSSVLNALDPSFSVRTGEISAALNRGRHTTRHVELYRLACGAEIIDTPGFSSFEAEELNLELKEHLPETFPEFVPYLGKCRFTGCGHTKERGCAVLDALRRGEIQPSRHASYVRLWDELEPLRDWNAKRSH